MKDELENKIIPILKWAGGKRQCMPELINFYTHRQFNNYVEPFVGGGALYLSCEKRIQL